MNPLTHYHKYLMLLATSILLLSCSSETWTEGYLTYGFKRPHTTEINFRNGGSVIFTANAESTDFYNMQYKLTMTIDMDGIVCSETSTDKPTNKLLLSSKCKLELTPGPHNINVNLDGLKLNKRLLSDDFDYKHNKVFGEVILSMHKQ